MSVLSLEQRSTLRQRQFEQTPDMSQRRIQAQEELGALRKQKRNIRLKTLHKHSKDKNSGEQELTVYIR
ncbi:MAG: hypothetical protein EZS28_011460 [Streblomastix strix]|uniref:Uncharacterized protein n=1 Tax=Streblomastix strix TaxID=222440 RepID=A0A5J4WDH2_9EUKA|nr:MAG: hypothetical protein EZS28_011460 [Streblomastix strix]